MSETETVGLFLIWNAPLAIGLALFLTELEVIETLLVDVGSEPLEDEDPFDSSSILLLLLKLAAGLVFMCLSFYDLFRWEVGEKTLSGAC